MFPFNPWRRWIPKAPAPTWRDFELMLAAYRLAFAACLFLFGLFCVPVLALVIWAIAKEEMDGSELWVVWFIGNAALGVILYQWATLRFLRKSWALVRTYRAARLADHSP